MSFQKKSKIKKYYEILRRYKTKKKYVALIQEIYFFCILCLHK